MRSEKRIRKGSITVYLAMILGLFITLILVCLQSVRLQADRTQGICALNIGLYSLFGEYDTHLLENYDLFFLDGSRGGSELDPAGLYEEAEKYMTGVIESGDGSLSLLSGGISGYTLATDNNGEIFLNQAAAYMTGEIGAEGIRNLAEWAAQKKEHAESALQRGESAENGNGIEKGEQELERAAQAGNAAQQSGAQTSAPKEKVRNPIAKIRAMKKLGILTLLVPERKQVSAGKTERSRLLSGRRKNEGNMLQEKTGRPAGVQILYDAYLMEKLKSFIDPAEGSGLCYELEYILGGEASDEENLKKTANRLLLMREGVNLAYLYTDPGKSAQIEELSMAIASSFLVPPAASVVALALRLCWAYGESLLDVRELLDGGRVPLKKSASSWQLSLEELIDVQNLLDSRRRSDPQGLSYADHLRILLNMEPLQTKLSRGMDMVEEGIRREYADPTFRLDCCVAELEINLLLESEAGQKLSITRSYGYK